MPLTRTDRPALVFDVLGTLVDQAGSLRARVGEAAGVDADEAARVVARWLRLVAEQTQEVVDGRRDFAPSHRLDDEALAVLVRDGDLPEAAADRLATAGERLRAWDDSVAGIDALARDFTVIGLSDASRRTLAGLSAGTGLRWHQVLSAEDARAYKPDPALYAAGLAAAPADSGPPVMVAAHAWDLRAAAGAGMRTAYVPRPQGDPPAAGDRFDVHAADLRDLHARLLGGELGARLS